MKQIVYSKKQEIELFLSGMIQVLLVAVNTYQLAHYKILGSLIVWFLISFVWSFNVKRVAFGKIGDRIIYASGAACGIVVGLIGTRYFYEVLLKQL